MRGEEIRGVSYPTLVLQPFTVQFKMTVFNHLRVDMSPPQCGLHMNPTEAAESCSTGLCSSRRIILKNESFKRFFYTSLMKI